ncbi:hypothetical protein KIPB_005822, partial [Kipferlia bialata]
AQQDRDEGEMRLLELGAHFRESVTSAQAKRQALQSEADRLVAYNAYLADRTEEVTRVGEAAVAAAERKGRERLARDSYEWERERAQREANIEALERRLAANTEITEEWDRLRRQAIRRSERVFTSGAPSKYTDALRQRGGTTGRVSGRRKPFQTV